MSGETWSVMAGRVARVFVAVAPGYYDRCLTPESVQANLAGIRDEGGYFVPESVLHEIRTVVPQLS